MIHGTLVLLQIMGVLPSSPWLHFQNEGVSLEWVKRDILVQKVHVKKLFFKFLTLQLNNVFTHNYVNHIAR